jgi:8-oxo-dGTP pyrophosphatase MutT (NUDIX family)
LKNKCSCGFIIAEAKNGFPNGWLLCHPTNCGNRWDFPKGAADESEDHFAAAKRELFEETGLEIFFEIDSVIDLGQHSYDNKKDLHLFYVEVEKIDTRIMKCISMVENLKGADFPEMDGYAVFEMDQLGEKVGKGMDKWIMSHVPKNLRIGYKAKS